VGPPSCEVLLARGVTFWVPTNAPQSLVTRFGGVSTFLSYHARGSPLIMPLSWVVSVPGYPSSGMDTSRVRFTPYSGLPPTGTRTYGLETTFLCYYYELSRSKASSRCRPLHGLSYPWTSGGNTIDISTWLCLPLATPYLGRCLSWAMSFLGDVRPPDLPFSNTSVTHKAATTDYVHRRTPLP